MKKFKNHIIKLHPLLIIIFLLSTTISCNKAKSFKTKFQDDFESGIQDYWLKEVSNESRCVVVKDPLNENNNVLRIKIDTSDYRSGGKRSELVVRPNDYIGDITKYSFKFLLPESFFQKEEKEGWIMIHQWHDEPAPGFSWSTYNRKTIPPFTLTFKHTSDGKYVLLVGTGLIIGNINEKVRYIYPESIEPNKWYTFTNEIKWHVYTEKSYAIPQLNGISFIEENKEQTLEKLKFRNMYNSRPNYFKFGLYWGGTAKHNREIFFDDIVIKSINLDK